MQNLAHGSRWIDGKNEISDCRGYYISSHRPGKLTVMCVESGDAYTVSSDDILAIIDRANLDPVRISARRILEAIYSELDSRGLGEPGQELADAMVALREVL